MSFRQFARKVAHAAALIFGAWWLVATSAPDEPPRDCFTGIANPTRLEVVLGPADADGPFPSCAGMDGLVPGGTLVFDLSQGPRPEPAYGGGCYGYETQALTGVNGVTDQTSPHDYNHFLFTFVIGTFTSPQGPDCRGSWTLRLAPRARPPTGQLVSPLDAGPAQPWSLERSLSSAQIELCDALVTTKTGPGYCGDTFAVTSIIEVAAP